MNGHPKEQTSFARVSGYVEQNDVHSPQTTVREALNFSAQLRFAQGVPADTIQAFVDEVMGLVELTPLQHGLVRLLLLFALAAFPSSCIPLYAAMPTIHFTPSFLGTMSHQGTFPFSPGLTFVSVSDFPQIAQGRP